MGLIRSVKVEIICVVFGAFGFLIAMEGQNPDAGLALCGTAVTSYFAFKKNDDEPPPDVS